MEHILKLNPKYFEYMKNGTKIIEVRLNDEKRRNIRVGDLIIFKKEPDLVEEIHTIVENLIYQDSFQKLVDEIETSLYSDVTETKEKYLEDIFHFYTKEEEQKYGVVGIKIKKV
ncbi:MAG: DUF3850 domain-containing protein [Clostridia bacterium]|nr:DUF3850 domain-containing protein [Clostridia bacterium]